MGEASSFADKPVSSSTLAGKASGGGGGGGGGSEKNKMRSSSRSAFSFPDIRRILLHGARAARGSPPMGRMCDPEKGNAGGSGVHGASPTIGAGNHSKSHGGDKHSSSNNLHGTPHNHHVKVSGLSSGH